MLLQASYIVNMIGGIAFIAVGVLLLALRPARQGALGFAAFALASGAALFFSNLGSAAFDERFGPLLLMLRLPFQLITPIAIVWGASGFRGGRSFLLVLPFVLTGIAGAALLVFAPERVITPTGTYIPLGDYLFILPFYLGTALAIVLLAQRHRREISSALRLEIELLLAGTAAPLGYTAGFFLALVWAGRAFFAPIVLVGYLAMFALCALAVLLTAIQLWRSGERSARLVALTAAALIPLGSIQGALVMEWAQFGGILRIAAALLLGYALLKFRVFDIDVRVKNGLARTLAAGIAVIGFFVVSEVAESFVADRTGSALLGMGAAAVLLVTEVRVMKVGRKIADRALPGVDPSAAYFEQRKLSVYRAAFESAQTDGELSEREMRVLSILARELGLTTDEVRALENSKGPRPA